MSKIITSPLTEALDNLNNMKNGDNVLEEAKIRKSEWVETYYPYELQTLLSNMTPGNIGPTSSETQYNGVRVLVNPDNISIIGRVSYRPQRQSDVDNAKLDKNLIGKELYVQLRHFPDREHISYKDEIEKMSTRRITINDFLSGKVEILPYDSNLDLSKIYYKDDKVREAYRKIEHLLALYAEAKESVQEEILRREQKSLSFHDRGVSQIMEDHDFPGITSEFLDWCKNHLISITVWTRSDLDDAFRDKFPHSEHVQNHEYKNWSDESYSWGAKVKFDEVDDCPNDAVVNLYKSYDKAVNSVGLAEKLYEAGFDFGPQPRTWKSVN